MALEIAREELDRLLGEATRIAAFAYAPYSNFRVGAAVLGEAGTYLGTNVENASFGLSLCAERSALCAAITAGDRRVRVIAVACIDAASGSTLAHLMPCGACRQWITELAPQALVLVRGNPRPFSIDELLPNAFRLG